MNAFDGLGATGELFTAARSRSLADCPARTRIHSVGPRDLDLNGLNSLIVSESVTSAPDIPKAAWPQVLISYAFDFHFGVDLESHNKNPPSPSVPVTL